MFTIGEMDVTLLLPILACVTLFGLQLLLCFKAKHMAVKLIPLYLIGAFLVLIVYCCSAPRNGVGFLDLTGFVALFMTVVAGVMGLFVGAAWLVYRLITRNR